MGGGRDLYLHQYIRNKAQSPTQIFYFWDIYMPMDDISKKIKKLIITNDFRERAAFYII